MARPWRAGRGHGAASTSYRYLSVSVVAPTATAADALSTAFCLMRLDDARAVADRFAVKARGDTPGAAPWGAALGVLRMPSGALVGPVQKTSVSFV
jgi:hypothetical protein